MHEINERVELRQVEIVVEQSSVCKVKVANDEVDALGIKVSLRGRSSKVLQAVPWHMRLQDEKGTIYPALRKVEDPSCEPALGVARLRRGDEAGGFVFFPDAEKVERELTLIYKPVVFGSVERAAIRIPPLGKKAAKSLPAGR